MSPEEQIEIKKRIGVTCPIEMHGCIKSNEGILLKDFIEKNKPAFIVETGSGISTFFILKALQNIHSGKLVSVDKYIFDEVLEHQDGDFSKRKQWILPIINSNFSDVIWRFVDNVDSVEFLKQNLNIPIDLFFHDSYHSIEHIRNEWLLVKDRIKWYGSHNVINKLCKSFFTSKEFTDEWTLLAFENTLGIWGKRNNE